MLTKQEIFDKVVAHLRQQKVPAMDGGHCAYRSEDGKQCAIGCLIADSEYHTWMEGLDVASLLKDSRCPGDLQERLGVKDNLDRHSDLFIFLSRLQAVHDSYSQLVSWEEMLQETAEMFGLHLSPL